MTDTTRREPPQSVRLDDDEKALLAYLVADLGINPSQVLKTGLRVLRAIQEAK